MSLAAAILPALGGVIAVLFALAVFTPVLPKPGLAPATAGLCGVALLVALAAVLAGGQASLRVPIGLGMAPGVLAIDPLGAWFAAAVALAGLAGAAMGGARLLPPLIAVALLVVLAADTGLAVAGLAGFAALMGARGLGAAGVLLVAGSLVALGGASGFAAIRPVPPEGWQAGVVLALLLTGLLLVAVAGPFRRLSAGLDAGLSAPVAVLLPVLTGYVLCRVMLDLSGPVTPAWWGAPALLLGAATACAGAILAIRAPSLSAVLAGLVVGQAGWIAAGAGLVAVARAADLLPLATLAGGGTMLHVLNLAAFGSLAAVACEAVARGAGSEQLDRLGGLAGPMTVTLAAMLLAGSGFALLPPGPGFAGAWMMLQSAFAATRLGGPGLHLAVALGTVGLAASSGLSLAAVVRLVGLAFLGRPRTPRAAAAEDARGAPRAVMLGLSGVCVLLGLFPGLAVRLAEPAQALLTRAQPVGQAGWAGVQTQQALPGYLPLVVAVLAVAGSAALAAGVRRLPGMQRAPAWEDGFAAPPPWMPFGEPATQATAATLASALPFFQWGKRPRITARFAVEWPDFLGRGLSTYAVLLILAVVSILAVLLLGPPLLLGTQ